jgi:hypothetical protein
MEKEPIDVAAHIYVTQHDSLYWLLSHLEYLKDIAEELAKIRMRLEEK